MPGSESQFVEADHANTGVFEPAVEFAGIRMLAGEAVRPGRSNRGLVRNGHEHEFDSAFAEIACEVADHRKRLLPVGKRRVFGHAARLGAKRSVPGEGAQSRSEDELPIAPDEHFSIALTKRGGPHPLGATARSFDPRPLVHRLFESTQSVGEPALAAAEHSHERRTQTVTARLAIDRRNRNHQQENGDHHPTRARTHPDFLARIPFLPIRTGGVNRHQNWK